MVSSAASTVQINGWDERQQAGAGLRDRRRKFSVVFGERVGGPATALVKIVTTSAVGTHGAPVKRNLHRTPAIENGEPLRGARIMPAAKDFRSLPLEIRD
jgi:hypothetical protein